jgi:hypothetical protein
MSKAIEGAAMLAGAVAVGVAEFALASTGVGIGALPFLTDAMLALAAGGVALEAGAIASALTSNRGMNITTRQPSSPRPIIYGMQRVGGVLVYRSTSLADKSQYNHVIVLAAHPCFAVAATYLDGRKVWWEGDGYGDYHVVNGYGFGGWADGNLREGPDGNKYSFGHDVFGEIADGFQQGEDAQFFTGLRANDPAWDATSEGSPYCGGCFYVYLKLAYNPSNFPQDPEIRFTVMGKMVYDPRTGTTTYSANSALIAADWISDTEFGLGMPVNQAQLIAAANVCDEAVPLAAGGTETRYTCHYHFDTSTAPSDALATILKSMGGRISVIGGEVYIWPAYWQGPSASFDQKALTAPIQWDPTAEYKSNCNRVTGTYTAPNYPYNASGDAYDANGFDSDGNVQNNFQFGFQPTSFPQYAQDPQHGYAADQWLNEDAGVGVVWNIGTVYAFGQVVSYVSDLSAVPYAGVYQSLIAGNSGHSPLFFGGAYWKNITGSAALPLEVSYEMVLSIAQAQRLAKIDLLRRRFWGRGTLEMGLAAFVMQEVDVMNFTFPLHGWVDKPLEIQACTFKTITQDVEPGQPPAAPECRLVFEVAETDPTIYEWEDTEELSIYDTPILVQQNNTPAPPTDVAVISGSAEALVAVDGTVTPRLKVTWNTPEDGYVTQLDIRHQLVGDAVWIDDGNVSVELNEAFISPIVSGKTYNVEIRSVRPNGASSVWVVVLGVYAGLALSITTPDGYGIGSLVAEAYTDGTAAIECNPFSALVGQLSLPIFPSGEVRIATDGTVGGTGAPMAQQTLYYVYYVDPNFLGGNVTPIATTNEADYLGKLGYFLIDSIVTPYAGVSGSGMRYSPTTFSDTGTRTTSNPANAYDNDLSTYATVGGNASSNYLPGFGSSPPDIEDTESEGNCVYSGFPNLVVPSGGMTLTVNLSISSRAIGSGSTPGAATLIATINGTATTMLSAVSALALGNQTLAIPSGVNLNTITVAVSGEPGSAPDATSSVRATTSSVSAQVYEIYAQ